jgi:hypothetical protein
VTRRRSRFVDGAQNWLRPIQKGLVLGVLAGVVLALRTGELSWIAAGVYSGVGFSLLLGRLRHTWRRWRGRRLRRQSQEERLRLAASGRSLMMVEGRTDRAAALEHLRDTVPGFGPERYAAELDYALDVIEVVRAGDLARRGELLAQARQMDVLNAVFALRYFNRRFSQRQLYGQGPIDLVDALGDLYSREQIDEAVVRSDGLIDEAIDISSGPWDWNADMIRLYLAHRGFNDKALADALSFGRYIQR